MALRESYNVVVGRGGRAFDSGVAKAQENVYQNENLSM